MRRCRAEGVHIDVELDGPVIDVAVTNVRLGPDCVGVSAKDAPVDIVEVFRWVALADLVGDALGEVLDEVIHSPKQIT